MLHDLTNTMLTDLQSLECLIFREIFFTSYTYTSSCKIDLPQSLTSLRIVENVYLVQNLHFTELIFFRAFSMRVFATESICLSLTVVGQSSFIHRVLTKLRVVVSVLI